MQVTDLSLRWLGPTSQLRPSHLNNPPSSLGQAGTRGGGQPTVHQGRSRRLWDILDEIRHRWLVEGALPLHGAKAFISPEGKIHLLRGDRRGSIS
jgi:hypothetical protein